MGGRLATHVADATCAISTDLKHKVFYLSWTTQYYSIDYPVCRVHRLFASVVGLVAQRSLFNLAAGFLLVFFIAITGFVALREIWEWVALGSQPINLASHVELFALGLALIGILAWIQWRVPVKISNVTYERATLYLSRKELADKLVEINQPAVSRL